MFSNFRSTFYFFNIFYLISLNPCILIKQFFDQMQSGLPPAHCNSIPKTNCNWWKSGIFDQNCCLRSIYSYNWLKSGLLITLQMCSHKQLDQGGGPAVGFRKSWQKQEGCQQKREMKMGDSTTVRVKMVIGRKNDLSSYSNG